MTSSGLKRPLNFVDLVSPHLGGAAVVASLNQQQHQQQHSSINSDNNINNNKRRCTSFGGHRSQPVSSAEHTPGSHTSAFEDPAQVLGPLADEVASMIREELSKAASPVDTCPVQTNPNTSNNHNTPAPQPNDTTSTAPPTTTTPEIPQLTVSQTQLICERLIRHREQRLREEYDKTLINKLAEQYDTFVKCSTAAAAAVQIPHSQHQHQPLPPHLQQQPVIAATTAAAPPAPAGLTPQTSLPDLSSFAASLGAATNGNHHNAALATSHIVYNLQQQAAALQQVHQQQQRVASVTSSTIPSGPVLLASSLDEQLATPEALFTLFGVFGDVIRVKILFNKKDNALIQMADANQAQVAQGFLDKQKVFGKLMRVTRSKHQLVQMPREGNQSDAGLTKDFTNSPLHRFKIPGSRNYQNIYPPSNTLHISNIPATADENDIHKAFKDTCGFDCSSFKFFLKNRKMALMKFDTIEQATIALIKMHNFQINEDTNLRVSFSKSVN